MTLCPTRTVRAPSRSWATRSGGLARVIEAHPKREALVDVPSGRRWTYAELGADVDEPARALLARGVAKGDRVGILGRELSGMGARPVRHGGHRRDHGQHQPRVPRPRGGVRPEPVGDLPARRLALAQVERLPRDRRRGPRQLPWAAVGALHRRRQPDRTGVVGVRRRAGRTGRPCRGVVLRRPGRHPVHLGHHRLPHGVRPSRTTTSSTTAISWARWGQLSDPRPTVSAWTWRTHRT